MDIFEASFIVLTYTFWFHWPRERENVLVQTSRRLHNHSSPFEFPAAASLLSWVDEVVFWSLLWEAWWWNNSVLNVWIIKYEQTVPLKTGSSLEWSVEFMWCFSITVAMLPCTCNKKHNWAQQNALPIGTDEIVLCTIKNTKTPTWHLPSSFPTLNHKPTPPCPRFDLEVI